jgi:hypothetical protein
MSPKPKDRLAQRLDQLGSYWLELRGCCQIAYLPLPLMVQRHGGALVLRDVLRRLRCSKCGRRPPIRLWHWSTGSSPRRKTGASRSKPIPPSRPEGNDRVL